jgi:fatty-acyl-CoA synthase
MELADWIATNARRTPEKEALRFEGDALSYACLAHRVDDIAAALAAADLTQGDCVAWLGRNSPAMLATLFACARLRTLFMPLNWRLAPSEHRAMLQDCPPALLCVEAPFVAASAAHGIAQAATRCVTIGSAAGAAPPGWIGWDAFIDSARGAEPHAAPVGAQAPILLCWTSGSTGRPKGVLLTEDALAANADASVDMHALTADDRVLTTLPLFHVGGLNIQTTPALRAGCTVTLHAKFDADATFDAIERERITLTVLVPAQLEAMIAHPRWPTADLSSLRMISTGSTLVPERLTRAVHARGVPLVLVWGATETAPIAACLHADEAMRKVGSTGRAAAGCELRIVDAAGGDVRPGASGEILVRGRNVMSGYWRDESASADALAGGWYHSGDSGHFDADGFLTIDGRLKDMIITGGENVSPAEVEAVLFDCPDIGEAAVVGRPDARWGEAVVAVVAPAPGATLTPERVLALFDDRLARFKHPKDVLVVEALPRTALGKVRKDDVRQLVGARVAAAALVHEERIG